MTLLDNLLQNVASPTTTITNAPVTTTSNQADYSKKYQISTQSTFAPVTTSNTTNTTNTTNAPQYLYAPVISYSSPGATLSGNSQGVSTPLNVAASPVVVPSNNAAQNPTQNTPSQLGATQTPTSSNTLGLPASIGGVDTGLLLLVGGGLLLAFALLSPTGKHESTIEVGRGSKNQGKLSIPLIG